jgi:peroxiredoxin/tetratricopeptide (TPR) repeat protein
MRTSWTWLTAVLFSASGFADEPSKPTPSATEANPAVPAPGHSLHGEAFDDGPRQQAHLMSGMGKVEFPASVANPEAQAFITQGVAQLHTFYYLEAERSFRQAAKLDPACPIVYWGMAMANVNNEKRARSFLKTALKKAESAKLTPREKLYLDALGAFYKEGADERARRQGWLLGFETIVQDFPDDLNARTWLAMVTWQNSSKDGIGSRQAVDTLIESVLQVESMHPGAHHYRIHLWDGVKPIRAVKSAALYGNAAPGIAHAWHMPGHTYTGLKRYADAAYQQEASARVDHASMLRERTMPFDIHNYAHNNQWLATSLSHIGRARDAITVARDLVEQPRDPDRNGKNDGGSAQRSGRARWMEVLVRYELWDDLIAATESGALDWSDVPLERRDRAYTLGLAYAAKADTCKLGEQIDVLKELVEDEPKKTEAKPAAGPVEKAKDAVAKVVKKLSVPGTRAALAELEGHQRRLAGDTDGAFGLFAKATSMRPEARVRVHLAVRQFEKAVEAAKKAVESHPNEVPPLAAYVEALQAAGKTKEAQAAYQTLAPLARHADPDLPLVQRLAAIVASWKDGGGWVAPGAESSTDDATANRIDLTTLGPLTWTPYHAEPIALADTEGRPWTLSDRQGKNVLVLFYLGGKCAHCMQQLQLASKEVEAFKGLSTEVVAVSTDDAVATKALKSNSDGIAFPMPLLADVAKRTFRAYRSHDDFEDQPLHGTFLIDAHGDVRFHRVAAEPFLNFDFLKSEAARINTLRH